MTEQAAALLASDLRFQDVGTAQIADAALLTHPEKPAEVCDRAFKLLRAA